MLAAFGVSSVKSIGEQAKAVLDLGEEMANAGKRAGLAAGQFYLFNRAMEKGIGMKTAAALIGENADALDSSATIFRDVSIKLWAIGEKIRGFWLGLMERVAPVLSRILDGALGFQLVSAGQMFGEAIGKAIAVIYQLAKDGNLWSSFKAGFALAFNYAAERMIWLGKVGYEVLKVSIGHAFSDGVSEGFASAWESVKSLADNIAEQIC